MDINGLYDIRAEKTDVIKTEHGQTILLVQQADALNCYEWCFGHWKPVQFGLPVYTGSKKEAETGERVD